MIGFDWQFFLTHVFAKWVCCWLMVLYHSYQHMVSVCLLLVADDSSPLPVTSVRVGLVVTGPKAGDSHGWAAHRSWPCCQGSRTESAAAGGVRLDAAPHSDAGSASHASAPSAPSLDSASREIAEVVFSPQVGPQLSRLDKHGVQAGSPWEPGE